MSQPDNAPSRIEGISTRMSIVDSPERFVLRYGKAIRAYIGALMRDAHDADDVTQELLLEVLRRGLARREPGRGRFRDYLRAIIRNTVADSYHKRGLPVQQRLDLDFLSANDKPAEKQWLSDWRNCILDAAWTALEAHEHAHAGNWCHTALRLVVDHPEEHSVQLAHRLSKRIGQPMRPDAFRKQVSRARSLFARLMVDEVRQTLSDPTPQQVHEELLEVGLLGYVRSHLAAADER
jgi:hypothetical protein